MNDSKVTPVEAQAVPDLPVATVFDELYDFAESSPKAPTFVDAVRIALAHKKRAALTRPTPAAAADLGNTAFLAARLRRLFAHFKYPLPGFAKDDASLIEIAGSCIGAILTQLESGAAAAADPRPVAQMVALDDGLDTVILDFLGPRPPAGTFLYAVAAAEVPTDLVLVPREAPLALLQQLTGYDSVGWMEREHDRNTILERLRTRWAAILELVAASPAAAAGVPTEHDAEHLMRWCQVLIAALKRLSFAAQTTGGTAGPDAELMGAISQATKAMSMETCMLAASPVAVPGKKDNEA